MTEQQYKKAKILYFITTIACLVSMFWGIFYANFMDEFHITLLLAVLAVVFAVSFIGFIWFLIWSLFTKIGKEFWVFYFKKRGLLDALMFKGQEPASVIKRMLLFIVIVVVGTITIGSIIN